MEYDVYLRQEAFEFLRQRRGSERDALLTLLWSLSRDPFRRGDFSDRDHAGREIQVLILRRFAIFYWADHAAKEIKVTKIRFADS